MMYDLTGPGRAIGAPATHTRWYILLRCTAKAAASILFALVAFFADAPPFLTVAFALCALGDVALSRPGRAAILYGFSSFFLAHFVFILLFQSLGAAPMVEVFVIAPAPAIALLAFALSGELWLAPYTGALRWPIRAFIALITALGLTALTLPVGFTIAASGVALFILSDLILALRIFRIRPDHPRQNLLGRMQWIFYIAGQSSLLIGNVAL